MGHRAGGLKFDQNNLNIYPNNARYINLDHFGDTDWYVVVAYEQGSNVPDRVGVTSGSGGGGVSIGISNIGSIGAW